MAEDNRISTIVEQSLVEATGERPSVEGGMQVFAWLVRTGETIPPWWSRARDKRLSEVWKESNHLSLAIYNTVAKLVGIPFRIEPLNMSNDVHVREAEDLEYVLTVSSGFGEGWSVVYSKFVEDLITTDNGAFMEVVGAGDPVGPIEGAPLGVRHLDSTRCTRTGHPIFPVLYLGDDQKLYKLHWTRVIYMSQMPSSRKQMNGVGFCGVSRAVEVAQTLADMVRYKQERLGSRPHNQLLVGKGVTGRTIMTALRRVDEQMSNQGFTKYARTVAVGSENPDVGIEKIDLTHMEPFDEEVSTNLGMFAIAAALGMDADEIWPVSGRSGGGSQGDANLRRIRSRGRLPAQLTAEVAAQFNFKVMPPHLRLKFDFKDDEEDQQRALIRDIRGRNRERDLTTGSINIRSARKRMLDDKDIDRFTFEDMEMVDGRLFDGNTIAMLFYDDSDPIYLRHLRFMDDPLRFVGNITDEGGMVSDQLVNEIVDQIQQQRQGVLQEWANTRSEKKSFSLKRAFHALDWLEDNYLMASGRGLPEVPFANRRQRTDIRVVPVEESPEPGLPGNSPAEMTAGSATTETEDIGRGG